MNDEVAHNVEELRDRQMENRAAALEEVVDAFGDPDEPLSGADFIDAVGSILRRRGLMPEKQPQGWLITETCEYRVFAKDEEEAKGIYLDHGPELPEDAEGKVAYLNQVELVVEPSDDGRSD